MRCAQREEGPDQAMSEIDETAQWYGARRRVVSCALAAVGAMLLSGCAQSSAPELILDAQAATRPAGTPICRPDPVLLAPQSAPDCMLHRAEQKTIDPDQWARLNVEYELQCYQKAEKTVRQRLNRLQAANRCERDQASRR